MKQKSVFLLVEDNEDDVFFMKRAFRDAGLKNELHITFNGEEAINYLRGNQEYANRSKFPLPDMVFLDLKMPGLDGFQVLEWIRREYKSEVPVAVLTSSPEELDMRRARQLGATCYLLKPPTREMIISCCEQFELQC